MNMLGLFTIGAWELVFIVAVWLLVVAAIVAFLLMLPRLRKGRQPPAGLPPLPPPAAGPIPAVCPRCGAALPANAPQGLCPRCVMGVGLATQTEVPGESDPHGTKILKPVPAPAEIAPLFPQLEILECLGRGGMGMVYKARQPKLNRFVALKILARDKESDPKFAERFAREAQALAQLNHPNIVTVYDFGETDGLCYLLMEFVDGLSLRQLLQARKMEPAQALTIVPKICEALQFAHEHGIVHRDIKPENILLDKTGRVKIADFGIAKMLGAGGRDALPRVPVPPGGIGPTSALRGAESLTQDQVLGTPHYMAPEQVERPQTVDHRADIYSLGVVFYEMLTGELPLGRFQPPSRVRGIQVDVRLDEVVLHALEKEPERRYQQASQVKTDVETIAAGAAKAEGTRQKAEVQYETGKKQTWMGFKLVDEENGKPVVRWLSVVIAWVTCWGALSVVIPILWVVADPGFQRFISLPACLGIGYLLSAVFVGVGIWWTRASLKADIRSGAGGGAGGGAVPFSWRNVPWQIWVAVAMLTLEGLGNAIDLPRQPQALVWVAAKVLFITGLLRRWRPVFVLVLLVAIVHIVYFASAAPITAGLNILLLMLVGSAFRYYFDASRKPVSVGSDKLPQSRAVRFGLAAAGLLGTVLLGVGIYYWLPHKAEPDFIVKGFVTDAGSGMPIPGARVNDNRHGGRPHQTPQRAWTDTNGYYELRTWPKEHALAVSAPGYQPQVASFSPALFRRNPETRMNFQLQPAVRTATSKGQWERRSQPDLARAVALFNDIEDFGHEFRAAVSSTNLAAAQTGTRRLLNLLTNFNTAVQGTEYQFPPGILEDVARIRQALAEGDWEKARQLGAGNDAYRAGFRLLAEQMAALARQLKPSAVEEYFARLLNDDQRLVIEWTDRQFRSFFDARTFEGWSDRERSDLETRLIDTLKGPQTREYYQAINTLAALRSTNALPALRQIAFDRADKDCRDRWMAVRALGLMGDRSAVPDLIHLVYHGNSNTRWWAQISLVRLTGRNFAKDWEAWGKWWNESGGLPPFKSDIIRWWSGQAEPDKLAASLEETDGKFMAEIRPADTSGPSAAGTAPTFAELPPVVVGTEPASGVRKVKAGVTDVRVRFSKEMMDGSWSWCTAGENSLPETIGEPRYEPDGRTCVMRVRLESSRTYAIWLNTERFQNFKDRSGVPAVPYLLIFETEQQ
jgi:tRNA A-37 threonylcarbamoyl transferase component Bud32